MFEKIFSRGPKISRPVVVQTNVNTLFPNSPIVIQPPQGQLQGDPSQTIYRVLSEIASMTIGAQFFASLQAAGKTIGVRYVGPNQNWARGTVRGYVLLRLHHDAGNAAAFAAELQTSLNNLRIATGRQIGWVANELYQLQFPTWTGGTIRPFANPAMPQGAPPVGRPQAPMTPQQIIEARLAHWIAGRALPDFDEVDAILIVLRDYLNPGAGVVTTIGFDPHKEIVNGVFRPPHCGLFHELVHAYYNATGRQLGREDSINEGNGGRLFELMAVGLGPFATDPFSENAFRLAVGVPNRTTYP